jgi:phage terminase large subunit GpA-like protein
MSCATITRVFSEAIAAAIPQAELSISQWAAAFRYLAPERSARPGRWRNEVAPYLAEIMDTARQPGVRETVFVKSAQVGGSECLNNLIGYFIHIEPCPILYLAEEEGKAHAWSTESLAPMIRETPVLKELIGDVRTRNSGNTIEEKSFPGGHLAIGWATSPATVSSRPRRVVGMDERDAYRPTKEGDPAALADERTNTYGDSAVIFKVSTPRDRLENPPGSPPDAPRFSPIEREYEDSDKRRYHVPCPHCGEYQPLAWKNEAGEFNVRWDGDDVDGAFYLCKNGCRIEHEGKAEMLARGRWVAEKPFNGRAGFHIWAGYSPFVTWGKLARKWLDAQKDPSKLRVFVNTSLAEGWEDPAAQASVEDLEGRERFEGELLPPGVLVITAGVDVQGDRLEAEKIGWGEDDETWSIDYKVFEGDPAQAAVWDELFQWLTDEHECEVEVTLEGGGTAKVRQALRVAAACVDSGGHHTEEVYAFTRRHSGRKFHAVKGASTPGRALVSKPTTLQKPGGKVRLYIVGTETAKDTVSARLAVAEPGPGYCHFPAERTDGVRTYYGEAHFKQLRSERPVVRSGVRRWEKIKASARNEALDCRVYGTAARVILNPDYRKIAKRRAAAAGQLAAAGREERDLRALVEGAAEADAAEVQTPAHDEQGPRPQRRGVRRRGARNYATSWKE